MSGSWDGPVENIAVRVIEAGVVVVRVVVRHGGNVFLGDSKEGRKWKNSRPLWERK